MSERAITLAVALVAVAVFAAAVMLSAARRPRHERLSRAAFWIVLAIIFAFIGLLAWLFLEGLFGGIGD
jgi:hypothetical protein